MNIDPKLLKTKSVDPRPDLGGWSSHNPDYTVHCKKCDCYYLGNKRSHHCADCAYKLADEYEAKSKLNVWKISMNDVSYYDKECYVVVDEISEFLDNCSVGDTFSVSKKIMTVEDYEKLPEFQGF